MKRRNLKKDNRKKQIYSFFPHNIKLGPSFKRKHSQVRVKYTAGIVLNAQSLNNKSAEFTHFICEHTPDLVALTGTWFKDKESAVKTLSTPRFDISQKWRTSRISSWPTSVRFIRV
jgi:hypothetical protein